MAETIGMGLLPEEAARELAEEATYRYRILILQHIHPILDPPRVRQLVQDSQKFMYHGKRHRLVAEDVDQALRVTGQEPLYGFQASEHIPFRCTEDCLSKLMPIILKVCKRWRQRPPLLRGQGVGSLRTGWKQFAQDSTHSCHQSPLACH